MVKSIINRIKAIFNKSLCIFPFHCIDSQNDSSPFPTADYRFWVDKEGKHPKPFTIITEEDIRSGKYKITTKVKEDYND